MEITSAAAASNNPTAVKTLGKEDFLRLFTTQLRYQNPINPMDSTEFTSQLAQFSSLEQLFNIGSQLKDLLLYQNSLQNTLTANLIGKEIKYEGDSVYLKDTATINYKLTSPASKVKITITDSGGKTVKEIELNNQAEGAQSYQWDGRDSSGNKMPEGEYKIKVEAFDSSGNLVETSTLSSGIVTGMTFENNLTYLIINDSTKIQLSQVREIKNATT
jgi:flagellar basal-body rod modification protein FlgD